MKDYKGVLIYGEPVTDKLSGSTCELIEAGRRIASDLGQEVACVLTGDLSSDVLADAAARGAVTIYTAASTATAPLDSDGHLTVAMTAVQQAMPAVILMGHTPVGRELGPRLAFRLGTAVTTDCIDVKIDANTGRLVTTKPVYGGNALADLLTHCSPQIATIRPKAMAAGEPASGAQPNIIELPVDLPPSRLTVKDRVQEEVVGVKLEDAPIIVSGGRGVCGPEPFTTTLKDLADALHGVVGASRPACDNGWAPESMHIGLTGKIVAPELYVAVAISGASQHMSGCSSAKTIVAINKDAEANIFREAAFGVVGRFEDVVPAFTAKLRELLAD